MTTTNRTTDPLTGSAKTIVFVTAEGLPDAWVNGNDIELVSRSTALIHQVRTQGGGGAVRGNCVGARQRVPACGLGKCG